MDFGAVTHPGYIRSGNEDAFYASREHAVFAVADGMGGHDCGEVASHLALEVIERRAEVIAHAAPSELTEQLHQTIQDANAAILSQAQTQDACTRMGTTLVLATICGDRLYFAHIGDSRLYLLRGELFTQLTRDHSLVQSMVDRGEISAEEAAIHPLRHQITRVVGGDDYISPEIASQALEPGDSILLCTDGLSGTTTPEAMKAILQAAQSAQAKADILVEAALKAGGPDNITAVVVHYQRPRPTPAPGKLVHPRGLSMGMTLALLGLGLALLAVAYGAWGIKHPRYYVATDSQHLIRLYMRWPLLPMLHRRQVAVKGMVTLTAEEARETLKGQVPDASALARGIPEDGMATQEVSEAFLHEIIVQTGIRLLAEAHTAIEQGKLAQAQAMLTRASILGADPKRLRELELLMREKTQTPPLAVTPLTSR